VVSTQGTRRKIIIIVLVYWGLTQGFVLARQMLCHLTRTSSPLHFSYFPDRVSRFWHRLALDCDSPHLYLLNSWDYRYGPLHLTSETFKTEV
jgi:hypothetical protein